MGYKRDLTTLWTDLELKGFLEDEDSCVYLEKLKKHLGLHPFHLNNFSVALYKILNSGLNFYDPELKGFALTYQNPKLLTPLGTIFYDAYYIHIDIQAEFYIFRPEVGRILKGFVNKKGENHLGVLVHKVFNVSIPKPENEEEWPGESVSIGQEIKFTVTELDFKSRLPYIRGLLNAENYLSGCQLFSVEMAETNTIADPDQEQEEIEIKVKKKKKSKLTLSELSNANVDLNDLDGLCYIDTKPSIVNGDYSSRSAESSPKKIKVKRHKLDQPKPKLYEKVKHKKHKKEFKEPENYTDISSSVLDSEDSALSDINNKRKKYKKHVKEQLETCMEEPSDVKDIKIKCNSLSSVDTDSSNTLGKKTKKSKKHIKLEQEEPDFNKGIKSEPKEKEKFVSNNDTQNNKSEKKTHKKSKKHIKCEQEEQEISLEKPDLIRNIQSEPTDSIDSMSNNELQNDEQVGKKYKKSKKSVESDKEQKETLDKVDLIINIKAEPTDKAKSKSNSELKKDDNVDKLEIKTHKKLKKNVKSEKEEQVESSKKPDFIGNIKSEPAENIKTAISNELQNDVKYKFEKKMHKKSQKQVKSEETSYNPKVARNIKSEPEDKIKSVSNHVDDEKKTVKKIHKKKRKHTESEKEHKETCKLETKKEDEETSCKLDLIKNIKKEREDKTKLETGKNVKITVKS